VNALGTESTRDQNNTEECISVGQTNIVSSCVSNVGACFPGGELKKSCGLSASKPPDLNFLPIHSSDYIEREREKLWKRYQGTFPSCDIPFYTGKPNYTRPKLPYLSWNSSFCSSAPEKKAILSMHDRTYDAFNDEYLESHNSQNLLGILECRQGIDHVSWGASSCMLDEFVKKLKSKVVQVHSIERKHIMSNVEEMVNMLLKLWEQKYEMFNGCELLKMGSTYEGTKIGKPDEFDFMIELPALCKVLKFEELELSIDPELKKVKVLDRTIFADIDVPLDEDEDDTAFIIKVWQKILELLCKDIQKCILPGWKWLNTVSSSYFVGKLALTQQLLWSGREFPSLVVDVDICLAVQQRYDNYHTNVDFNQAVLDQRRPGISDETKHSQNESDFNHIVLRSDGRARITMAVREMQIWRMKEAENKRVLYRCVKFMVSKYLPKTWNNDFYILDSIIPSYWLKTMMFYMFEHYINTEHWSESNLPIRLAELFLLLRQCIKMNTLSSFFVPHNILKIIGDQDKYLKIEQDLGSVIDNLCKLQLNDKEGFTNFDTLETKMAKDNEETLQMNLYKSVVELLYFYAYNEYSPENLKALQEFVSVFLRDRVRIEGEGKTIKIWYDQHQIDLNKELYDTYGETEVYFT
jgi:hypothetical protein